MKNISKMLRRALDFWKAKIKARDFVVYGGDFPDEYVRRILQKEDLILPVKKGLYIIKNKGAEAESLIYQLYWTIAEKILQNYAPWSIEKESAMSLHLGEESIPQSLKVRTLKKIKHNIALALGLKIKIRPDPAFHEKTRQNIEVSGTRMFVDTAEKVLLSIKKRSGTNFTAFLKGIKFDKRALEVLYAAHPKPIVVKELIKIADKNQRTDLALILKNILREYTVYR